ncbi:SRPBCC domain-containing protein [Pseudophaeobacter sp.]|uniref:SRPBCC family protein n=1 Tax=Pseudophaeobacter sp. TaxID=1971739 RepID=UPI00329699A9
MSDVLTAVQLDRVFPVSPERLFAWITQADKLLQWWGPEGIDVYDHALDLTRTGAYFAKMRGAEGQQYHVSGHVTHVTPPRSVGFTWGWHDESGARGPESHVTFTIEPDGTGARLRINHQDLPTPELAESHAKGWTSTLNKLASKID